MHLCICVVLCDRIEPLQISLILVITYITTNLKATLFQSYSHLQKQIFGKSTNSGSFRKKIYKLFQDIVFHLPYLSLFSLHKKTLPAHTVYHMLLSRLLPVQNIFIS